MTGFALEFEKSKEFELLLRHVQSSYFRGPLPAFAGPWVRVQIKD